MQKNPCKVKLFVVNDMTSAEQTADIISRHITDVEQSDPDPLLKEGRPCHTILDSKALKRARVMNGLNKRLKTTFIELIISMMMTKRKVTNLKSSSVI
jgi:hypothetical protein